MGDLQSPLRLARRRAIQPLTSSTETKSRAAAFQPCALAMAQALAKKTSHLQTSPLRLLVAESVHHCRFGRRCVTCSRHQPDEKDQH